MRGETVCGIDEAGRGPVIGPLVLACVTVNGKGIEKLVKLEVKDSKRLTPAARAHLEPLIKEVALEWRILRISPAEIDLLRKGASLNLIEAQKTAQMILSLKRKPTVIIVDAADTVEANYHRKLVESINSLNARYEVPHLLAEHKADDNYPPVSAASILAKVERDRCIERLKKKHGNFGSGYPSDELTQNYIRKVVRSGEIPDCVRKSWNTLNRGKQTSMGEYL